MRHSGHRSEVTHGLEKPQAKSEFACSRAQTIAQWFGISHARQHAPHWSIDARLPSVPAARQILLITGPSGAGKSTLLREYRRRIPPRLRIELQHLVLLRKPIIELFDELSLEEALLLLSRMGLAEAHSYRLPPAMLSDGQRWRLRLAMALYLAQHRPKPAGGPRDAGAAACILADEFAGLLDRVTGTIVANMLRRAVDGQPGLRAIVASSRDDLAAALRPDVIVTCDFGRVYVQRAMQ